ncbi:unnamed protein product [Fraxinus pennsylvanica]|uniref:Uncharacterized protein n=1 Tax=Fraxinus pennsylvanica TaxID=56036 RepID=A0AAD1ZF46_9LAMI|nr:unnamed protein product [Fraxinus pennsylvanica]
MIPIWQPLETEARIKDDGNPTSRGSSFSHTNFYSMVGDAQNSNLGANDDYGLPSSRGPTPRPSTFEEETKDNANKSRFYHGKTQYPAPNPGEMLWILKDTS